jgi:hypothetical protein
MGITVVLDKTQAGIKKVSADQYTVEQVKAHLVYLKEKLKASQTEYDFEARVQQLREEEERRRQERRDERRENRRLAAKRKRQGSDSNNTAEEQTTEEDTMRSILGFSQFGGGQ